MPHTHARWTSALMLSTLAATGIAFVGRGAEAQESKDVVTVQARILQNGVPVNADLDLTFEVYTASAGGTLLWSESQSNVPVRNGILAISLGTASSLGSTFKNGFNATSERWLAVKQGGVEIVPRVRLTAVPYAHAAGTAEIASAIWDGTTGTSLTLSGLVGAGLEQDGSGRLRISSSAAGDGLTGGSGVALAVGQGNGITVSANAVAVDPSALLNGASIPVDADRVRIDLSVTNYTPTTTGTGGAATAATDLAAHLKGIDNALTGGGSGTVVPGVMGGRLTASSTEPVPAADVAPVSTLYYLPFRGSLVSLYTGSAWVYRDIGSGLNISVSGLTADHNYDIFMYDNAGTPTLDTPVDWSTHGAGSSGRSTTLTLQDGVWVKTGATTRRYLGTIRTVSSSGVKVTDTAAKRFVWNAQNRNLRAGVQIDATNTWSYASTTLRAMNGGAADWKFEYVVGLLEDDLTSYCEVTFGGGTTVGMQMWIQDNGVGYTAPGARQVAHALVNIPFSLERSGRPPATGYNYRQACESGENTTTYKVDNFASFGWFSNKGKF